jgi:hypothetical protein
LEKKKIYIYNIKLFKRKEEFLDKIEVRNSLKTRINEDNMGMNWVYKVTKGELVDRMEEHHLLSEGTFYQLRQRLVHFVRENEALFPGVPP